MKPTSRNSDDNHVIAASNRGEAIILATSSVSPLSGSTGPLGTGTSDPFANFSF